MGILNGNVIVSRFKDGLYNRTPESYEVYVDGELIRYKGMTSNNLTRHDAEHGIANSSFLYLCRLIRQLEEHLNKPPHRVTVYMDGKRVTNKICHFTDFQFDVSLIRTLFTTLCIESGMFVNHLDEGESELQMHMKHNCQSPLTVYITCDTDLISILYGHKPLINDKRVDFRKIVTDFNNQVGIADCPYITINTKPNKFQDTNLIYTNDEKYRVKDSIVWLNCVKDTIVMYGMDNTMTNMSFNPNVFRSFMALCGTDFTPSALPISCINAILKIDTPDVEVINNLNNYFDIFATLLIVAYKNGGVLKQKKKPNYTKVPREMIELMLTYYIDYVTMGIMTVNAIPQPPMPWLTRYIICCALNGKTFKTKRAQIKYINNCGIRDLLCNVSEKYDCDDNRQTFFNSEFLKTC
uniref:GacG_0 protein n=1 Tax=Fopius arisanus TaxID=64838 RepID=A0A0C9RDR3_9HYME